MKISSDDRISISGLGGSGKTTFLKWLAHQCEPDLIIIDPLDQYGNFPDECRYIPKRETPDELEAICKSLYSRSNITLVIEEAEQYLQQGRALLQHTSGLIRMGRNWGIGIYATTRRIQDINKRFFDLAQHCFFFRCGLKSREYIADMIGKEFVYPVRNPRFNKTGYCLMTLPPYHALHFNLETEEAEVVTLKMGGAREHVETVGPTAKIPDEDTRAEEKYQAGKTAKEEGKEEAPPAPPVAEEEDKENGDKEKKGR